PGPERGRLAVDGHLLPLTCFVFSFDDPVRIITPTQSVTGIATDQLGVGHDETVIERRQPTARRRTVNVIGYAGAGWPDRGRWRCPWPGPPWPVGPWPPPCRRRRPRRGRGR